MKRCWIGVGLLLVLLVLAIGSTWAMGSIHEPIAQDLDQAAECAILGDWANAKAYFYRAKSKWEEDSHFRACLADHTPTEEIDAQFALLEAYCYAQEDVAFAGSCRELAKKTAAVGEAHELVWWNIF